MQIRRVHIPGIGDTCFIKNKRSRHIRISVEPRGLIRVSLPYRTAYRQALDFVIEAKQWILDQKDNMNRLKEMHEDKFSEAGSYSHSQARSLLIKRTYELSRLHGFTYKRITIRYQRTRWGSCSADNTISLNAKIVKLPVDLRDYVILHELLHTKIKNHAALFWKSLDDLTGSAARILDKRLSQYKPELM